MHLSRLLDKASLGVLYFGVYSLGGWLLESAYRSITLHHFVNPGFLHGPFLPIYGSFGLLAIAAERPLSRIGWGWHYIFFVAASTLLEFVTGSFFWRFYHLQLWSYSDIPLNYNGFIALPFSLVWGLLGLGFQHILHPKVKQELSTIPLYSRLGLASLFGVYLIWDLYNSSNLLRQLDAFISQFPELYEHLQHEEFARVLVPFQRLFEAYPDFKHSINKNLLSTGAKLLTRLFL